MQNLSERECFGRARPRLREAAFPVRVSWRQRAEVEGDKLNCPVDIDRANCHEQCIISLLVYLRRFSLSTSTWTQPDSRCCRLTNLPLPRIPRVFAIDVSNDDQIRSVVRIGEHTSPLIVFSLDSSVFEDMGNCQHYTLDDCHRCCDRDSSVGFRE